MLDGSGDDVVAASALRIGDALDGEVVGFAAATGEDDLSRAAVERARDRLVGAVNRVQALASQRVDAAGIAEELAKIWLHARENLRARGGRRSVIEVDNTVSKRHEDHILSCSG